MAAPVMGLVVLALVIFDVPFAARFALSQTSLERLARTVASGPENARYDDQWVGLYPLSSIERIEGGAQFLVDGSGFLDRYGFAWSPGKPPSDGVYTRIDGSWYVWQMRW